MSEPIQALCSAWCRASQQELRIAAVERIFFELHKLGFTAEDVTITVEHLMAFNRKSGGAKFRINVVKVCADPEIFAGLCAEARATARNRRPAPTERDKIVALHEQPVDPEQSSTLKDATPGRPISEVFEAIRKAAS